MSGNTPFNEEIERQRRYYAETAAQYDGWHLGADPEHELALGFLSGVLPVLGANSVLDVGAGTGRTICFLQAARADLRVVGVEPVDELRAVGYDKGLSTEMLRGGDGAALPFSDGEFDVVCAFAVLHHVREPNFVVREMLRVAGKAVFISDSNNFGQGTPWGRAFKQLVHACGLWPAVNYVKTKGKGYTISDGDGLAYSYSVFDTTPLLKRRCRQLHFLNLQHSGHNLYRSASHVAVLAVK